MSERVKALAAFIRAADRLKKHIDADKRRYAKRGSPARYGYAPMGGHRQRIAAEVEQRKAELTAPKPVVPPVPELPKLDDAAKATERLQGKNAGVDIPEPPKPVVPKPAPVQKASAEAAPEPVSPPAEPAHVEAAVTAITTKLGPDAAPKLDAKIAELEWRGPEAAGMLKAAKAIKERMKPDAPHAPEVKHELTGAHHGQYDFRAAVNGDDGKPIGYADYSIFDGKIAVKHVHVEPSERRKGVATSIYDSILKAHPEAKLERSMTTDEGGAFRAAFDQKNADRLAEKEPERNPQPFTEDEWNRALEIQKSATSEADRTEASKLIEQMNDYDNAALSPTATLPERPTIPQQQPDIAPVAEPADKTATPEFKRWFGQSKVVDESGKPLRVFHGTRRSDRIAEKNKFDPKRATSWPMAFFTSDPDIASSYSTNKQDTSLEPPESYAEWFKIKVPGARKPVNIDRAWWSLAPETRQRIAALAPRIATNDDQDPVMLDESHKSGVGNYDYEIREKRGNALAALVEGWLNGGTLYGREEEFLDVLKMAGLDGVEYHDPYKENPGVFPVHLSIQNPLDTGNIPPEVVNAIAQASKRKRGKAGSGADQWDKRHVSGQQFMERLNYDLQNGTTYAWTSIPDFVTDALRQMGYDGIKDTGGKQGGREHAVWIPFGDTQIKSATANRGTYNPNDPRIDMMYETPDELGFVNNILSALQSWQGKGTPQQLLKHLEKTAGAMAQADVIGLKSWLAGKQSVTKQEVADFVAGEHPELGETSQRRDGKRNVFVVKKEGSRVVRTFDTKDEARDFLDATGDPGPWEMYEDTVESVGDQTHFEQYTIPGPKENYDEIHVTADVSKPVYRIVGMGAASPPRNSPEEALREYGYATPEDAKKEGRELVKVTQPAKWQDGHSQFSHVQNPVVRLRVNDRRDADGKRVLFLEEMQGPSDENQAKMPEWLRDRIYDIGMKRALRMAVEGGYDRLAWTTGETQAERYDLSKHIATLRLHKHIGSSPYQTMIATDPDGRRVIEKSVTDKEIEEHVGKDVAAKLAAQEWGNSDGTNWQGYGRFYKQLNGVDLKIGGEGLKSLYDRVLPAKADKLLKKAGVRVGRTAFVTGKRTGLNDRSELTGNQMAAMGIPREQWGDYVRAGKPLPDQEIRAEVHSIDLTPAVRDLVSKGMPLFNIEGSERRPASPQANPNEPYEVQPGDILPDEPTPLGASIIRDAAPALAAVDPSLHGPYTEALTRVVSNMPDEAAKHLKGVPIAFHESADGITNEILIGEEYGRNARAKVQEIVNAGQVMGGVVVTMGDGTRRVLVDGGKEAHKGGHGLRHHASEYYAHELTHIVDYARDGGRHSNTPEWQAAYDAELASGRHTQYATISAMEGFAEFGRAVYSGQYELGKLKTNFPKCWAYFVANGLVKDAEAKPGLHDAAELFKDKVPLDAQGGHADLAIEGPGVMGMASTRRLEFLAQKLGVPVDPERVRDQHTLLDAIHRWAGQPGSERWKQISRLMMEPVAAMSEKRAKTDTPEFKRWFGASKVVDAEGKPLVVYHGTNTSDDFNEFVDLDRNAFGGQREAGHYFTTNPDYAADVYARGEFGKIVPVFLSIKNPFYTTMKSNVSSKPGLFTNADRDALIAKGYDGLVIDPAGRDGEWDVSRAEEVVAFRDTQIKSAIANDGSYDLDDARIDSVFEPRAIGVASDRNGEYQAKPATIDGVPFQMSVGAITNKFTGAKVATVSFERLNQTKQAKGFPDQLNFGGYAQTQDGTNPFKVFSYVANALREYIDLKNPGTIAFSAVNDEETRVKLYRGLAERAAKKWGYVTREIPMPHTTQFILRKPEVAAEDAKQSRGAWRNNFTPTAFVGKATETPAGEYPGGKVVLQSRDYFDEIGMRDAVPLHRWVARKADGKPMDNGTWTDDPDEARKEAAEFAASRGGVADVVFDDIAPMAEVRDDGWMGKPSQASGIPKPKTLYRAADDDDVREGFSFAEDEDAARAYMDNPGFGGSKLWRVNANVDGILDLSGDQDPWGTLSEIIDDEVLPEKNQYHFPSVITADSDIRELLRKKGYRWVKFDDDFPEGSVTYVPLSDDAVEEIESSIVEHDD